MTEVKSHCPNCGSTDIQLKRNTTTVRAHGSCPIFGLTRGETKENLTNYC